MQAFDLIRPKSLGDAASSGAKNQSAFIGGGTDLMQLMKDNIAEPAHLVDIDMVLDDRITADEHGLRMGAKAKMSDVGSHPVVAHDYPVIAQSLLASASPQVRNMATIGGNILQRTRCGYFRDTGFACNKRIPGSGCPAIHGENRMLAILGVSNQCIATNASDFAVALAALDAKVELHGPQGDRAVPVAEFHREPGNTPNIETVLRPGEIITAFTVPASALARRSHYLKVRDRASFEWAVVSAAVALDMDGDHIREARVAMGGVGTRPWRSLEAEQALKGQTATEDNFRLAAEKALAGAKPAAHNGFKVTLAQRAVTRALIALA